MWNREALHTLIAERLKSHKMIVVSNREPYLHTMRGKIIECQRPASGMVTALDPILRACGGIWVAHGSGNADRKTVDAHDRVAVPPEAPEYTLRRVWLTKEQEARYYYGLSNEGLWPLCHVAYVRPRFLPEDWQCYREVNERFARAVLEETEQQAAFVFIQDFHFALLPRMLKQANPNLIVAHFWHIPWPNRELIRTFPWKEELIDGLLGNDLLGFHLRQHCQNFLDTTDRMVEALVDHDRSEATRQGHSTLVRPFPISIDFEQHSAQANSQAVAQLMNSWRERLGLGEAFVGVGIERLDYTKGIPERLRGIDRLLERYPEYRERMVFIQVGVPSRSHIEVYQQLEDDVETLIEEINWKWSTETWRPIHLVKQHLGAADMTALARLAHFCIVSSLHDGMNLVAKEFVANRSDGDGVLILSHFAGASLELTDALLVNPFALDEIAEAIRTAIELPETERRRRMSRMRDAVAGNNIYRWAGKILSALLRIEVPDDANDV
jgi:trehalose 6-phosphate synthase